MIPTIWQLFVHKTAQDYALEDIHAGKSAPRHVDPACLRWPKFNFLVGTPAPPFHGVFLSIMELILANNIYKIICSYRLDDLENISCDVTIRKALITCEHFADMACSADPESYVCTKQCGGVTTCCGRDCRAQCHQCQMKNATSLEKMRIDRKIHVQHNCEKLLYCAHRCSKPCSLDHECATTCNEECRQKCAHTRCRQFCSTPCAPCQEPCTWSVYPPLSLYPSFGQLTSSVGIVLISVVMYPVARYVKPASFYEEG